VQGALLNEMHIWICELFFFCVSRLKPHDSRLLPPVSRLSNQTAAPNRCTALHVSFHLQPMIDCLCLRTLRQSRRNLYIPQPHPALRESESACCVHRFHPSIHTCAPMSISVSLCVYACLPDVCCAALHTGPQLLNEQSTAAPPPIVLTSACQKPTHHWCPLWCMIDSPVWNEAP
jgi:hypothetical protein